FDTGRLAGQFADLIQHALGAVERGAVGQLHGREQIALVLDRDKTRRHARQTVAADADQDERDDDREIAVPDHAADQPGIAAFKTVIYRVEAAIEPIALARRYRPA